MLRPLFVPFMLVLLASCGSDTAPTAPAPEPPTPDPPAAPEWDLSWLEANAVPFRTSEPDEDFSDLMGLKEIIGDARIVALGEATHGTREFFEMKHRILRFLVREMGFDVFGIEATWAESNLVDEYVHTGAGNPAALLSNLHFWTWRTQEVLDMILWMREHNQAAPPTNRVSFSGFDMQFSAQAMDDVMAFLAEVDPNLGGELGSGYLCWRIWERARTYPGAPAATREECRQGVESVYALLEARRDPYEQASSSERYARALRAARIVVQHEYTMSRRWVGAEVHPRDRFMAENAAWRLEQAGPGAKIVLWAHNGHVMDAAGWMGSYLRETYDSDMVIVGFSFHRGEVSAVAMEDGVITGPLTTLEVPPARDDSYQHTFNRLEEPRFFVDLRPLRPTPPASAAWLEGPLPFRMIGAAYGPDRDHVHYWPTRLLEQFDVIIHFRHTRPSVLLPVVTD